MREELHKLLPKELLQEEFNSGLWHKEIAEKYNISWRQIYYLVEDYGLNLPRKNQKKIKPKYKCSRCGKEFTILHDGICNNCLSKQQHLETEVHISTDLSPMHSKILELRKEGKSYSEIAKEVGCNTSTVSYHCNINTKLGYNKRAKKNRNGLKKWLYTFTDKVYTFRTAKRKGNYISCCEDWNKKLRTAVSKFRSKNMNNYKYYYTSKDVLTYFGTKVKCGLTGREIDITKDDYHLDHIIPISRGGTNDLDNMQFTIPEANYAKGNMLNEEFVQLCKEVCEHFGYEVKKKE